MSAQVIEMPVASKEPGSLEHLRARFDASRSTAAELDQALKEKRVAYDLQKEEIEQRWLAENSELISASYEADVAAEDAESDLRKAILVEFEKDPNNKQVAPSLKLSVQVRSEPTITDKDKMTAWAIAHPDFMINEPDLKAIKDAAKNDSLRKTLKMEEFIEIKKKPVAVIGSLDGQPSQDPES